MNLLLVIEPIFLVAYLWYIIHTHAANSVNFYVKALTLVSWLLSFSLIILFPLDLYINLNKDQQDVTGEGIQIAWTTLYWITFVLTWVFLPLTMDYEGAGEFTFKQRLYKSVKINLLIYGIGAVAGLIFTIVMLVKEQFTFQNLIAFVVVLSNGFGLLIVTFLLGWAMVAIPKQFWRERDHEIQLKNKYFWAAKSSHLLNDLAVDVEDIIIEILAYQQQYKQNEEMGGYIQTILANFTVDDIRNAEDYKRSGGGKALSLEDLTVDKLAELNKKAKELQLDKLRTNQKFLMLLADAVFIEDIIATDSDSGEIRRDYNPANQNCWARLESKIQFYVYVKLWPYLMYFMTGIFIAIGGVVLFSDITIFVSPKLDPLQYFLTAGQSFWQVQLIILVPVLYVLYCVQYGMLRVRLNRYGFYDQHCTDGQSLMFVATFVSRIAFPMAFNFFWMFGMSPSDVANVVGNFNFDQYLKSFKLVLPCLLIVLVVCNILDIYDKILGMLGFSRFQFDADYSDELIDEGKELVSKHRQELVRCVREHEDLQKQANYKEPLL